MERERRRIRLVDGRTIEAAAAGPADATPFLFHHGTPGSAIFFEPFVDAALARGLRYVAYSRPGYGGSTRRPGRSVVDCVPDAVAVVDHFGNGGLFYTLGWSGGAPHALACCAALPDRVIAAASLAGPAPIHAEDLDWLGGMGKENIEEFGAALAGADQLQAFLDREGPQFAQVSPEWISAAFGDLLGEVDRTALTGEFASFLAENIREALREGTGGWFDDDMAFVGDWGFDLEELSGRAIVWHGGQDRMAPFSHGRWLASHIPGARTQLRPEHGHLSLAVGEFGMILDDLISD
jgi:pimeloyl-ACP methyl ester carboxylesterase